MINIITSRPLGLETWKRYTAYIHRIQITRGWEKKCYVLLPLNNIDNRFEYIETVLFEVYDSSTMCENSKLPLIKYIENTLNVIYNTDCNYKMYVNSIAEEHNILIPWNLQNKNKNTIYWKNYFSSYEVKGFKQNGFVIDSPNEDDLNLPSYIELVYLKERKGKSVYRLKDIHALAK